MLVSQCGQLWSCVLGDRGSDLYVRDRVVEMSKVWEPDRSYDYRAINIVSPWPEWPYWIQCPTLFFFQGCKTENKTYKIWPGFWCCGHERIKQCKNKHYWLVIRPTTLCVGIFCLHWRVAISVIWNQTVYALLKLLHMRRATYVLSIWPCTPTQEHVGTCCMTLRYALSCFAYCRAGPCMKLYVLEVHLIEIHEL